MNMDDYSFQMPGRIVDYDPATQTSTVKICNDRNYDSVDSSNQQTTPGLLFNVPTFTPGGGGWHMTFPIVMGDTCLLSFSQFGYDHWLFNDEDAAGVRADGFQQPWTFRKFDLADGFAQVGWNNIPKAIANYSATDSQWRNDDATQKISLNVDGSISVDSTVKITATAPDIDLVASTKITATAPDIELIAAVKVTGTLEVTTSITSPVITGSTSMDSPAVTIDGLGFGAHVHTEQGDGNDTSVPK